MLETIDKKVFDEFYHRTYNDVLKYVVMHCRNSEDIDDIMQNIYIALYHAIEKNKPVSDVYIFGIAKNKVKDFYRFKYRHKVTYLEDETVEPVSEENIEKDILLKATAEEIFNYVKRKDICTFQVFFLYFQEDYALNEIAEELNISLSQVKNKLYRTINEMKEVFGKE